MSHFARHFVATAILLTITLLSYGQYGFYKNFWGLQDLSSSAYPIVTSLDRMHDGGYILTTVNQLDSNGSYLRLDANFKKVWATNYIMSSYGFLNRAIELDDNGFVGIYRYDFNNYCFTKHDASGHPVFSNYYHTATSTNFATNAICKSSSHDSGFVVLYTGCELHYGICKFNKNGDVQWCYDFATNGYTGQTYDLINGLNRGYITSGLHRNATTGHMAAVVAHFNNDGSVLRAKEYIIDSTKDSFMDNPLAAVDNHYYTIGNTQNVYTDRWIYLSQLDSSLNLITCWKIRLADTTRMITVENIVSLSDSTIVINGRTADSTGGGDRKAFILRFNPKAGGSIVWAKSWTSPSAITFPFSLSNTGLFSNGVNDNLVLSLSGNYDGPTIQGIDKNGNGLCNTSDLLVSSSALTGFSFYDAILTQRSIALIKYPATLTEVDLPYKDTLLCGSLTLEVNNNTHAENAIVELVTATHNYEGISLKNLTDNSVEIDLYAISGQTVAHLTIPPYGTMDQPVAVKGIYVIRAVSKDIIDVKKRLVD